MLRNFISRCFNSHCHTFENTSLKYSFVKAQSQEMPFLSKHLRMRKSHHTRLGLTVELLVKTLQKQLFYCGILKNDSISLQDMRLGFLHLKYLTLGYLVARFTLFILYPRLLINPGYSGFMCICAPFLFANL